MNFDMHQPSENKHLIKYNKKKPTDNNDLKKYVEFKWHFSLYIHYPVSIIANHGHHVYDTSSYTNSGQWLETMQLHYMYIVFSNSRFAFALTIPTPWMELRPISCNSSIVKRSQWSNGACLICNLKSKEIIT